MNRKKIQSMAFASIFFFAVTIHCFADPTVSSSPSVAVSPSLSASSSPHTSVSATPSPVVNNPFDLYIAESSFATFPESPIQQKKTRIYITLINTSPKQDMKGVVRAFDDTDGKAIDIEQTFTVLRNNKNHLFFDYIPEAKGVHQIAFRIIPWEEYEDNALHSDRFIARIFVDGDKDGDGAADQWDAYPDDPTEWMKESSSSAPTTTPTQSNINPPNPVNSEGAIPPVVILSQMNPFSLKRGDTFTINSGLSRGFLGENLATKWEIFNESGELLKTAHTPEFSFSISWIGNYTIKATITNESQMSAEKIVPFSVRFSWWDILLAIFSGGIFIFAGYRFIKYWK